MTIVETARAAGILTEFYDALGQHRIVPDETLARLLDALPRTKTSLHPAIVLRENPASSEIVTSEVEQARWSLFEHRDCIANGQVEAGKTAIPILPSGIYRLEVEAQDETVDVWPLIVAPSKAFLGDFDRVWLIAVQLYSVRSDHNWGIGDFGDLRTLIEMAAEVGCAGIGLNPLHVLFDDDPANCSPYAPNSRLFLNPIYIDVDAIEGRGGDTRSSPGLASEKANVLIDYSEVWGLKQKAIEQAYLRFQTKGSKQERAQFDRFRRERGQTLARFAFFETLRKRYKQPWWEWPERHRSPDDALIEEFRSREGRDSMEYVEYVQWIAHEQLMGCSSLAKEKGLSVGLYIDVAVGVRADGFDAWCEQEAISRGLSVGAPPDLLNVEGQDWGLAGFNGPGLAACDFEPFQQMIEASAHYAGAIRLDHVMGLARLYLVPTGVSAQKGAYVTMPLDPLMAVVALESQANRCVVIGEDLGTVPDGFRETMNDWGIWSYKVLLFEREHDGRFKAPDRFDRNALVTFNTHDLPSFAGWRDHHDLRAKWAIQIDPGESDEARAQSVDALDRAIADRGIAGNDFTAAIQYLDQTSSRLMSIALDDVIGVVEQVNIPGTVDSHPNWRRRLPVSLEEIAQDGRLQKIGQLLRDRRSL